MRKIKLFLSLLMVMLLSVGQMWGADQLAYTIEFQPTESSTSGRSTSDFVSTMVTSGDSYISSCTATANAYPDVNQIKLGSSSKAGSFTLSLSESGQVKATKVVLSAKYYDSGKTITLTANSSSETFTPTEDFADYELTLDGTADLTTISVANVTAKKGRMYVNAIKVYVAGGDTPPTPTCATPTFTPAAGAVLSGTEVTISSTTDGATIHYTTDGTEPTASSATYSAAIPVTSEMTIKAIAVKDGYDNSSVASAAYTIATPLTTMQAIFEAATAAGSTATPTYITFSNTWVVTGVSTNGKNVYITDGTKGMILFNTAGNMGLVVGNTLSGTVQCNIKLYNGAAELDGFTTEGLTKGTADLPNVQALDAEGIAALTGANTGSLIKISGECTSESSKYYIAGVQLYNSLFAYTNPTAGSNYNVTGVYVQYNSTKEVLPRSAADIEEVVTKYTVTYDASPANGSLAIYDGSNLIASGSKVNENTVLTITTTPSEGYTQDGVTVNGSPYTESTLTLTEDVTIAATFKVNTAPEITSYVLSENGTETDKKAGQHVGDKDNLPLTAASCSKTFRGWTTKADFADGDESLESFYAPGAEITLAANNMFYAVYADAHVVTPTDHALGSLTVGGTSGNTASEGYTYTSNKTNDKAGYTQDSGTKDADIVHLQIKAESQIINEEPSAIILTAHLGAGADRETLTYPVNAVLVDADGNNVGDPVVLTNSIPDKNGDDFSANLPTANYANVRGVKISHMKEDGWNIRYYSMSFKYQTGGTTYDNYSTDCQAAVATPTFSPAAGTYTAVQNVTISSETTGTTIYYTTNGDDPTTSSTLYNGAVEVGESMTLKAIAVKSGMADSEIASAAYTINLPLSTMDQIFAAATAAGSTATDANIAFNNWVVSGVSTNGKNVFVTDGTKGFIIFDSGASMGFAVGDVLSGTVACKVQLYKGAAELTTLSSTTEGLNVVTGGTVTPEVKAISALSGINTGAAVTINSVQFDGTNLSDGANSIKPYNSLFAYEDLTENSYYNVTGIYQQFDATKEILPRSAADIEAVNLDDPELSYSPASVSLEVGQALSAPTFNNPHDVSPINYAVSGDAVATVTNEGVIALVEDATGTAVITASFAGNAQYALGNATFTITVTPASVSENVVVLAEHNSKFYAMTTTITNETAVPVEVEYDGTKVTVAKDADKDAIQWTKKTIGENITFQTKDEYKLYLKGTSGGATLSLNATACNWAWDGTNNCYVTGTRGFIYRISTNGFKNYGVSNLSNADYVAPQVIVIDPANIVVTEKADAELAYNPTSVTLTVGGEFIPATLTYAEGFDGLAAVTYASSNENVATVNESGVVSLEENATGTATITATFAGNNNYLAGSASYVITVNEAGDDLTGVWVLASSVKAGDKIIIMGANNADIYTMGKQNANPNRAAVASTIVNNVLTPGAATKVFTLVDAGEGKFAIQASNGKYLTSATEGSNNSLLEAENYDLNNAKWTITIENGSYSIVAAAGNKTVMQYNSGSTLFSCYGSANQKPVKIYVQKMYTRTVTNGNYGTICLPQAGTITGATLFEIGSFENNMIYVDEVLNGAMEAGKPYIFQATSEQLNVTYTSSAVVETAGSANGLHGFYDLENENAQKNLDQNDGNYILYQNAYWLVSGRAAYIANYRAYIKIAEIENTPAPQQGAPRRRVAMTVHGEQTATGMENVQGDNVQCTKIMINGQLFILRGEKLFDATGRLVK